MSCRTLWQAVSTWSLLMRPPPSPLDTITLLMLLHYYCTSWANRWPVAHNISTVEWGFTYSYLPCEAVRLVPHRLICSAGPLRSLRCRQSPWHCAAAVWGRLALHLLKPTKQQQPQSCRGTVMAVWWLEAQAPSSLLLFDKCLPLLLQRCLYRSQSVHTGWQ